ncbi:hypothetical protein Sme01_38970 [Sphaerisporangium melleum]|uniref:Methyltransferase domain-containing protein n=1 Tax=Sphaerisporangium melleum TaxID=321316 RepID=A0A917R393_9ACTN|nr:class I SAM-dependent methyltransferase [Sphaerisporangium melleum]GGK85758.1 hypothetical protein GCM10007964_30390 [Sphaerisporangium melleum]GII71421.1 hypothetical protein Sme01_38970 [Sphaerisporangium melleum]
MTAASRIREASDRDRDRLHWLLDHLPASRPGRPVVVLDLGCAEGGLSLMLAERGDLVTGVDRTAGAIAEARRRAGRLPADVAGRLSFTTGDAHDLDCVPDGAFDAAVAGEILDRVGDPVRVLEALHRTLRPGATLVFTVPYGVNEEILRIAHAAGEDESPLRALEPPPGMAGPQPGATDRADVEADVRATDPADLASGTDGTDEADEAGPADAGVDDADRRRVFYHGSLRHLVEPLFEIRELTVLRHHLAGVAIRRDEARGTPGFALSRAETAFLQRERLLHGEIAELRALCEELAARESALARTGQDLRGRNAELRAQTRHLGQRVRHLEGRLAEYRELIARLRRSRAWRLITAYRRVRYSAARQAAPAAPARHAIAVTGPAAVGGSTSPLPGSHPSLPGSGER